MNWGLLKYVRAGFSDATYVGKITNVRIGMEKSDNGGTIGLL